MKGDSIRKEQVIKTLRKHGIEFLRTGASWTITTTNLGPMKATLSEAEWFCRGLAEPPGAVVPPF